MANNMNMDEEVRRAMQVVKEFAKLGVTLSPAEALSYVRGEQTPENMDLETTMNESNTGLRNIPTKMPSLIDPSNPLNDPGFQEYMRNNPRTAADEAYTTLVGEGMNMNVLQGMTDEEIMEELRRLRQRQSTMDRPASSLFNLDLSTSF
jgi:hypothetical protein